MARNRADVYDPAIRGFCDAYIFLDCQKKGANVNGQHSIDLLSSDLLDVSAFENSGIVDKDVECAKA